MRQRAFAIVAEVVLPVLLDLKMPKADGIEVPRRLKAGARARTTPRVPGPPA